MLPKPQAKNSAGDVLIVIGDASETVDTLYPYFRLQESGFRPYIIAPEKRLHQMVLHEVRPGWTITKEWEGYQIMADAAFADVCPEDYQGIFFSGGRAPEYIRYNSELKLRSCTLWEMLLFHYDHVRTCTSVVHSNFSVLNLQHLHCV